MQRTDETLFKSNYAMLNLKQLSYYRDSTKRGADSSVKDVIYSLAPMYRVYSMPSFSKKTTIKKLPVYKKNIIETVPEHQKLSAVSYAQTQARSVVDLLGVKSDEHEGYLKRIRRYMVEYQRKFTLSFSCLVLFSIGAPLGAIIRKGGLGLPVVMSIIFFLIYHIISTIGEKAAKEGSVSPVVGMWVAIFILAPLGIFLTYKATSDSVLFDIDYYKQLGKKFLAKYTKKS